MADIFTFNLGSQNIGFRLFCGPDGVIENRLMMAQFSGQLPPGIEIELADIPEGINYCDFREWDEANPSTVFWPPLIVERVGDSVAVNVGIAETQPDPDPDPVSFYATSFPLTENPLSENGAWTTGLTHGLLWTDPETNGLFAHGTMTDHLPPPWDDSLAHLSGFGNDHYAQGIVHLGSPTRVMEVELLLRFEITANNARGYQVVTLTCSCSSMIVLRNGPQNDFMLLHLFESGRPARDGDIIRAEIVGTVITVKRNGNILTTYDTASDSVRWSDGNPGLGFFHSWDSPQDQFGWSGFEAGNL